MASQHSGHGSCGTHLSPQFNNSYRFSIYRAKAKQGTLMSWVRHSLGPWKPKDGRKTLGWDLSKAPSRLWDTGSEGSPHICYYHLLTTFPVHIPSPGWAPENDIRGRQMSAFYCTSIYLKQSIPFWQREQTKLLVTPWQWSGERGCVRRYFTNCSWKNKHKENNIYSKESEVSCSAGHAC